MLTIIRSLIKKSGYGKKISMVSESEVGKTPARDIQLTIRISGKHIRRVIEARLFVVS
jgi:hypothetical protein